MAESAIAKQTPPQPKDWRGRVENRIKQGDFRKEDMLEIIWLAQDLRNESDIAFRWFSEQGQYLNDIIGEYMRLYSIRFKEQPPPRPQKEASPEILIDTPERRKQVIQEVALAITKPGDEISDETILEELKRRSMRLVANNPTATISTILNGFKHQFEKVQGKRGIFKRQG